MQQEADVFEQVEGPGGSGALVHLLLVLGLVRVDSFEDAQAPENRNQESFFYETWLLTECISPAMHPEATSLVCYCYEWNIHNIYKCNATQFISIELQSQELSPNWLNIYYVTITFIEEGTFLSDFNNVTFMFLIDHQLRWRRFKIQINDWALWCYLKSGRLSCNFLRALFLVM